MSVTRKFLKTFGWILLALVLVSAVIVAFNFTYLERSLAGSSVERVRDIGWFEPKEELAFSLDASSLVFGSRPAEVEGERFADAISYAESIESSTLLIWHQGQLVAEKYWSPYDSESYTQTQSVHKSLLGMLVGIALEEGAIQSLQDPVSNYLGDWVDQPLGSIRVEHLLNMSSGLGKEPASFFLFDHFLRLLNSTDISKVAQSLPQNISPGTEFEYINNNPQLLVDVLEAATGMPYEDYLQEKIWSKMAANPGYLWMDREGGTPHGYCCLMALPEDLLRIGLLVLNKGELNGEQIVPEDWINRMITPSELNPNYGYLVWLGTEHQPLRKYSKNSEFGVVHSEPFLADDVVYFDGFGGQRVYVIPSRELVIVRVGETRFDFDDAILPNRVMEALDKDSSQAQVFDVGYEDISLETEHSGAIDVRISYPLGSNKAHPFIIFSHGHYLTNTDYHALTDKWVEQGYVVAAPLHLDTGSYDEVAAVNEKFGGDWVAAARPLDMLAILDSGEDITRALKGFQGSIRTDQVIAAGHSLGALSAQWMAGATFETHAWSLYPLPEKLSDPRIVAVVAISPPGLFQDHFSEVTWSTLSTPQLVVTGTNDVFEHVWTDYREHLISYYSAIPGNNYALVIDEMDHYLGNLIGRLNREEEPQLQALDLVVERSLAFMDAYLESPTSPDSKAQLDNFEEFIQRPGVVTYEQR